MGPAEGPDAAVGRGPLGPPRGVWGDGIPPKSGGSWGGVPPASRVVSRPDLTRRLGASARVTVVSAPPGSGKSVLLRSGVGGGGLEGRGGGGAGGAGERDP